MTQIKNEQHMTSLKSKLGNNTYTVKVHFSKDTDKIFKDKTGNSSCIRAREEPGAPNFYLSGTKNYFLRRAYLQRKKTCYTIYGKHLKKGR